MAILLYRDAHGPGWSLLTWLAEARFLSSDDVALRYYPTKHGVRSATYRLAQLATWGLVTRRKMRRSRQVWHLTDAGARLVADYLGVTPGKLGYDGTWDVVQPAFVRHRQEVTRFEVALLLHARSAGGKVVDFAREPILETEAGDLRPDARFTYTQGRRTWSCVLEVDRNTERPARFVATKVPRYEALTRSNWRIHWDELPTCLVVVTEGGPERALRLKREIDALPVTDGAYRLFKFGDAAELYRIPPSVQGALPATTTHFADPVCWAARKPETERRAVLG